MGLLTESLVALATMSPAQLREQWTTNLEEYRSVVEQYGIDLGGDE